MLLVYINHNSTSENQNLHTKFKIISDEKWGTSGVGFFVCLHSHHLLAWQDGSSSGRLPRHLPSISVPCPAQTHRNSLTRVLNDHSSQEFQTVGKIFLTYNMENFVYERIVMKRSPHSSISWAVWWKTMETGRRKDTWTVVSES